VKCHHNPEWIVGCPTMERPLVHTPAPLPHILLLGNSRKKVGKANGAGILTIYYPPPERGIPLARADGKV